jgi:hypothetical protein
MAAAGLLATLGLAGAVWAWHAYRHTLAPLPPLIRVALLTLRILLAAVLFLILANPERIPQADASTSANRRLALVIDHSRSMLTPDNRGETRLENGLKLWKRIEPRATAFSGKPLHYGFDASWQKLDQPTPPATGGETHLFQSLTGILQSDEAEWMGLLCITDGIDTSGQAGDAAIDAARARGVPLYFIVGRNRLRPAEFLELREFRLPGEVLRKSQFLAAGLLELHSAEAGEIILTLSSSTTNPVQIRLPHAAGSHLIPWKIPVTSDEPGNLVFHLDIAAEGKTRRYSRSVRVVDRQQRRVLLYQGAPDWGGRFLLGALRGDPSFSADNVFDPGLKIQPTREPGAPERLPDRVELLNPYHLIILSQVFADALDDAQIQALTQYVKEGGSLLFTTPDTASSQQFSGTPLEEMLPFIFNPPPAHGSIGEAEQKFQELMVALGGARNEPESAFARDALARTRIAPLIPFTPTPQTKNSPLFTLLLAGGNQANLPRFTLAADIRGIKPGAEILALGPAGGGDPSRILMARQSFGQGVSMALATDLLGQWRMSLPSSDKSVEIFWQQLVLALSRPGDGGLRFLHPPLTARTAAPVTLTLVTSGEETPTLSASDAQGRSTNLTPHRLPAPRTWQSSWTPDAPGVWTLTALEAGGQEALTSLEIDNSPTLREDSGLSPDLEGLRRLASLTGGAVFEDDTFFRQPAGLDPITAPARPTPLWHHSWLLLSCLFLYGCELLLRRKFQLL